MIQEIITAIIVTLCIVYIIYSIFRKKKRKHNNCSSGCDGCQIKEICTKDIKTEDK